MAPSRSLKQKEDPKYLLSSLVENSQLGPAIKAVYDRGWQESFADYLVATIEEKDAEIRNSCNENYEEFISAIDNLLTVKTEITDLKTLVAQLNDNVRKTGTYGDVHCLLDYLLLFVILFAERAHPVIAIVWLCCCSIAAQILLLLSTMLLFLRPCVSGIASPLRSAIASLSLSTKGASSSTRRGT